MEILLLITVTTTIALCGAVYVAVVRPAPATLRPVTVGPFAPGSADPANDTLTGQAQMNTVLADADWNAVTLNKLTEVEDLLDYLEMNQVTEREVHTLGNAAFCVRWR